MRWSAATGPVSWFYARVLHHIDRLVYRLTRGRRTQQLCFGVARGHADHDRCQDWATAHVAGDGRETSPDLGPRWFCADNPRWPDAQTTVRRRVRLHRPGVPQ
jgi:hypothetical protein